MKVYNRRAIDPVELGDHLLSFADRIRPHMADVSLVLNDALDAGKTVLFEGAQAHHLDVDFGTYPYVTSSNPIAAGACIGSGVGPTRIDRVVGISKAYTTRVGSGPMPTELLDQDGEKLRTIGAEYGTTTGRQRRCGWFDALVVKAAARVNGFTDLFLTKLDILSAWDRIPVCVAYDVDGERTEDLPYSQTSFHHAVPVYEFLDGWGTDITGCRTVEELPKNARAYVDRVEELTGTPIWGIGVGAGREATIEKRPF